jgi:hypothetical protein
MLRFLGHRPAQLFLLRHFDKEEPSLAAVRSTVNFPAVPAVGGFFPALWRYL